MTHAPYYSPLTADRSPLTTAKASVTHTTTLDKLDDPLIPTSGYAVKLSNEVTAPLNSAPAPNPA